MLVRTDWRSRDGKVSGHEELSEELLRNKQNGDHIKGQKFQWEEGNPSSYEEAGK